MTNSPDNHIYRLTYEAFAQFTSSLTTARNLDQVVNCLEKRVKYLFDYKLLRVSFRYTNTWVHITVGNGIKSAETSSEPQLYKYERELRQKAIPRIWEVTENCEVARELGAKVEDDRQIWGWHFKNSKDKDITISLVTASGQNFSLKSIPFVRLFIEILESKLTEIALFEELEAKSERVKASLRTIEEKNVEIETIMEHQDAVIKKQTGTLKKRNEKLVEISVLNAHSVREPLSRIIGLANLVSEFSDEEVRTSLLPMIQQSSEELDLALKEVINIALNDIEHYKT